MWFVKVYTFFIHLGMEKVKATERPKTVIRLKEMANANALRFAKLEEQFRTIGFTNYRAMARVIHDCTGTPYTQCYRALLYMADFERYTDLMEETILKLKDE